MAELAALLGVSKREAAEYARLPSFPKRLTTLDAGPLWVRADVKEWSRTYLPYRRRLSARHSSRPSRPV
jgi:hypothetical protein